MFCSPEYCNIVGNIVILIARLLWASCNRRDQIASWNSHFTTRFVNKVSDWLLVAKKNQSICSEYLIGSSLLLVANQRLCLQICLWISTCNVITSVATCSEQSRNKNCNIPNNIAIFREQNIRFDCKFKYLIIIYLLKKKGFVDGNFECKF
jgi:hypothetical protein